MAVATRAKEPEAQIPTVKNLARQSTFFVEGAKNNNSLMNALGPRRARGRAEK